MVHILKSDYETITAECPHCRTTSVYNRVSDIGDVGPYVGRDIPCLSCGRDFWISMDKVGPLYQMFIHAAEEHFGRKHYMLAVASLGQAWEVFFLTYARDIFLYRPFFATSSCEEAIEELNAVAEMLDTAIEKTTFSPLRNLFFWTTIKNIRPQTLAESTEAIARIVPDRLCERPKSSLIESLSAQEPSASLRQLFSLTIAELRNNVVHKYAFRPSRSKTERCLNEEMDFMYSLKHLFRVGTYEEHAAGVI